MEVAGEQFARRNRNLTLYEGKKSTPLHVRRNTSAPNFPLNMRDTPKQEQQENGSWPEGQEGQEGNELYPEDNRGWYDGQYDEYGYQNEWNGAGEGELEVTQNYQGEYQQEVDDPHLQYQQYQQYQQEEYPSEYPLDGEGQYLEYNEGSDPNATTAEIYDEGENAPYEISVSGGSGLLQTSNAASVATTPSKLSVPQRKQSSTAEDLSLKLRGQEILLQQALQQLKAVEEERQTLNERNQKLLGDTGGLEVKLARSLEVVSGLELETQRLQQESTERMKLLEMKDSMNLNLEQKIFELEKNMRDMADDHQRKEQELQEQYSKREISTVSVSLQTDDPPPSPLAASLASLQETSLLQSEDLLQHKLQLQTLSLRCHTSTTLLSQTQHTLLTSQAAVTHLTNEVSLWQMKLKAANFEIESLMKELKLSEDTVTERERERYSSEQQTLLHTQQLQQRCEEDLKRLGELEREVRESNQKIVLLKKKVNAYKEINCLTCGENFYQAIVKLRAKFQRQQDQQQRQRGDRGEGGEEREGWQRREGTERERSREKETVSASEDILRGTSCSPSRSHGEGDGREPHWEGQGEDGWEGGEGEEVHRVGVNGIRKLRVQSANGRRGRQGQGQGSPSGQRRILSATSRRPVTSSPSPPSSPLRQGQRQGQGRSSSRRKRSHSAPRKRSPHRRGYG